MSGAAWIAFVLLVAFVLLAVALSALERDRDEKEPHRDEEDEP